MRTTVCLLMTLLAAGVLSTASAGVAEGGKKYLVHGWEFKYILPSDVLRDVDRFRDVPFDGVVFRVNATNSLGESMMSPVNGGRWERAPLERQIPDMRRVLALEHFRESFLAGFGAPQKRIAWTDDAAWERIAGNMADLGWFAHQCGFKGVECDVEDYYKARQFYRTDTDPEWDELVRIVRRRGAQVFGALFREHPEVKVMFLWIMNSEHGYMNAADPVATARNRGDLDPAFFDGVIDALPETARLINGDENCYFADYIHRSYHKSRLNNFLVCPKFFSPENREKYRRLSQASFGFYYDMLVNDLKNPYSLAPINGSRVEHFRRNLRDATELADEYVWIWGEAHTTVDWAGAKLDPRIKGKGTWSENAPGLYEAMKCCKDPDRGLLRRYRSLKESGRLRDLNENPACTGGKAGGALPRPYASWRPAAEKDVEFSLDLTQGCGDSSCLRIRGTKRGCIYLSYKNLPEGSSYILAFDCKGPVEAEVNYSNSATGRIRSQEHALLVPAAPGSDGWRHARAVVTLPVGADGFTFTFTDGSRSGQELLVDNVHVHPFDFTDKDGFPLVANPSFDAGRLGLPKTMGRDYWTVLRSSDGPYADPARKLNEKDAATGLANLPLFRECALRHSSGRNDPTNPAWASWRKVVDNFAGGERNEKWRCLEANAKPDVPVFVSFGAKRSYLAQVGKIDLDFDDYRAWRARHPNLVALQVGDEWGNDIHNMWCRFNNPAVCTNIWKTQGERDEVKARLFSFPFTHAGMLQRAKAYFDRVHALYWDTPDVLYACRECFCLDHVAAAWGADILSMETTNTSGGGDPEFRWDVQAAFTRGAARQFGRSWQWYVAQFVDGYNSDGRYEWEIMCNNWPPKSNPKQRLTGGCSPSLVRRICYYAYLNGANSVEMEDWGPHLLCPDKDGARVLSDRGRDFAAYHDFTREHPDRGETYAPVAILLPFDQGYTYCGGWNWRSRQVEYRPGDHQVDGLFFTIVPGFERMAGIKAGKEFNLHNTPFAMMYDVLVPDSPQPADAFLAKLTAYPVAVLAGEYPDVKSFWPTLGRYVQQGGTLVVNRANVPANTLEKLADRPGADVADESGKTFAKTYDVGRGRLVVSVSDWMVPPFDSAEQAVADTWAGRRAFPEIAFLLKRLQDELFPFAVAGSCQYGANRTKDGWWLWALNNDGITKFLDTFAKADPSAAHEITVDLKGTKATDVTELLTGRRVAVRDGRFSWTIPAGDLAIFRIN